MDSLTPLLLLFLSVLGWLWYDAVRAREVATNVSRRACDQCHVQFLDQTVRLSGLKLARLASGSLGLHRHYHFEFSEAGADRQSGSVVIKAGVASEVILEGAASGRLVIPVS